MRIEIMSCLRATPWTIGKGMSHRFYELICPFPCTRYMRVQAGTGGSCLAVAVAVVVFRFLAINRWDVPNRI